MGDDQRQRVLVLRADMQEMDVEAVDGGLVLAPTVQHRLAAAPDVAVTPVIDQRLDLGERRALGPVVNGLGVRPAGLVEAAIEVLEVCLRDGEGEGGDGVNWSFTLCFDRLGKSGERHGTTSFVVGDANLLIPPTGH
jgi:hypothetical protein